MKHPAALLVRILLGAFVSAIVAVAPSYAQHGGGGGHGGGSHGGGHGGGSHSGGGSHGSGGHSGSAGGAAGGMAGMHASTSMAGPMAANGSASHSASSRPNWGPNVFVPQNELVAERLAPLPMGSMHYGSAPYIWQEPPTRSYPSHITLAPTRWANQRSGSARMAHTGIPPSVAPAARMLRSVSLTTVPMGGRVGSQVFAESVRQPNAFFFPHHHFFHDAGFFFFFGSRHRRFGFFGAFPFQQCFFDGFGNVCAFEPAFFSPFFGPFGFGDVGWGWSGYGPGYSVAEQPTEEQPAETSSPNDYSTYQPGTAPEPLPPEQASASPLILLVLKDGTVYGVTDYWLEKGRLHYLTSYGGVNDISVDQLDLQKTVDQNWARGVEFVLRPAR